MDDIGFDQWRFCRCENCSIVVAKSEVACDFDFLEYGDYLLTKDTDVKNRLKSTANRYALVFRFVKKIVGNNARLMDFGCGAGYLIRAARDYGLNIDGVEESEKLRSYASTRLDVCISPTIRPGAKYDVIFMNDVIEHLEPSKSRTVMNEIVSALDHGGYLVGNTPNFRSLNIMLFGNKDPVISPPSHSVYYSKLPLRNYLESLGLREVVSFTAGLSSNAFLRKSKHEKSFIEQDGMVGSRKFVKYLVLLVFKMFSVVFSTLGMGYQIYFVYKKKATHDHGYAN